MKVAVYIPDATPYSMQYCAKNIIAILEKKEDVDFTVFKDLEDLPISGIDIYWDPRCGGGIAPALAFKKANKPLVLTVHGMAMFTLPLETFYFTLSQKIQGQIKRWKERLKWSLMQSSICAVMTVSEYTKSELINTVHFPEKKITAIWNGVAHDKFKPVEKIQQEKPYFLTIISYQKKKNFERLIEAYQQLDENTRPRLVAIVKPYTPTDEILQIKGLEIINTSIEESQLISIYQQALAMIFVSLHEGFGLPIAEAMACGVPVITSNSTSCKEIADDAASLVDATDKDAITKAMQKIINDEDLRNTLIQKGLKRTQLFNWQNSAEKFYAILKSIKQ